MDMDFSQNGVDTLKQLEGFSPKAYKDSANKSTIGYGHVIVPGDGVAFGEIIDPVKATSLLLADVAKAVDGVNAAVTNNNINQNQFDAMVIFAYNVGVYAFQSSTLLRKFNAGDIAGASDEFPKWNKIHTAQGMFVEVTGLTNRRLAEQKLFNTSTEA